MDYDSFSSLVQDCEFLGNMLDASSQAAARLGHRVLQDWHFFVQLVISPEFEKNTVVKAALHDLSGHVFIDQFACKLDREAPIPSVSAASPAVRDLLCAIRSDAATILRGADIGPGHFCLAYLSRPENMVYDIYQTLNIDVAQTRTAILQAMNIDHWRQVDWYYGQLHDTCITMRIAANLDIMPSREKIEYIERYLPITLPPDADVDYLQCGGKHQYWIKARIRVPKGYFEKLVKERHSLGKILKFEDNTLEYTLPGAKGRGKMTLVKKDSVSVDFVFAT